MSFTALLSRASLARPLGVGLFAQTVLIAHHSRATCESVQSELNNNPLMKKDGLPLFKEIQPSHIVPALQADLNQLKTDFKGG